MKFNYYAILTKSFSGLRKGTRFELGLAVQGNPMDFSPFLCYDGLSVCKYNHDEIVIPWDRFEVKKRLNYIDIDVTQESRAPFIRQYELNVADGKKRHLRDLKRQIAEMRKTIRLVYSGKMASDLDKKLQELLDISSK